MKRNSEVRPTIVDTLDPKCWAEFVHAHPKGSIFHTPEMFEVFRGARWHTPFMRAALDPAGGILALVVSVRVQTLPDPLGAFSSRALMYAEPLCRQDEEGRGALRAVLAAHDARMQRTTLFAEVRPLRAAGAERAALEGKGYVYADYMNFLADLSCPIDELWKHMSRQCKGNIRHGEREGLTIREVNDAAEIETVYSLLQSSYAHAHVPMANKSLFDSAFRILHPRGMLRINLAVHNGIPLGADLILLYRETVFDWYRGLQRVKSLYPGECLVWHQIEWAKQQGFGVYDFAGAGYPNLPYGVRDFKAKFGGTQVNYGRYRRMYAPLRLALAERIYEWRRKRSEARTRARLIEAGKADES